MSDVDSEEFWALPLNRMYDGTMDDWVVSAEAQEDLRKTSRICARLEEHTMRPLVPLVVEVKVQIQLVLDYFPMRL